MNIAHISRRIHPLVAIAAVSVTLVSLLGIAAITGVLPNSHGLTNDASRDAGKTALSAVGKTDEAVKVKQPQHAVTAHPAQASTQVAKNDAPIAVQPQPAPAPKPEPKNSPVGIGVGALIGGVLGNQIGSGDGKTLATIAGAVGGGYIGNEVAKKNQQ